MLKRGGKEYNLVPAPEQLGPLASNIQALGTVWLAKYAQRTANAPAISMYKARHHRQQEEERRQFLLGPNGLGKCDLLAGPPPYPLRMAAVTPEAIPGTVAMGAPWR